ncbi:hypothetical protein Tco_1176214 [Tanacetum coccineum]
MRSNTPRTLIPLRPKFGGVTVVISDNSNDLLLEFPQFESFHFDPSSPHPPPEPPDVEICFNFEPDAPMINNFDEFNEDKYFDPGGGEINVSQNIEDDDSFTFVIRTFLPFLTYPVDSLFLFSLGSEDTIFDPRHLHLEPVASHRDGTFMCFNVYPNINESPIEIFLFHLLSPRTNEFGDRVKLCDSVSKNKALRGRHPMLILLSIFFLSYIVM